MVTCFSLAWASLPPCLLTHCFIRSRVFGKQLLCVDGCSVKHTAAARGGKRRVTSCSGLSIWNWQQGMNNAAMYWPVHCIGHALSPLCVWTNCRLGLRTSGQLPQQGWDLVLVVPFPAAARVGSCLGCAIPSRSKGGISCSLLPCTAEELKKRAVHTKLCLVLEHVISPTADGSGSSAAKCAGSGGAVLPDLPMAWVYASLQCQCVDAPVSQSCIVLREPRFHHRLAARDTAACMLLPTSRLQHAVIA
jgi:hypothetical protein